MTAGPQFSKPRLEATVRRTVEWVDTDASGHQHNAAVLRWVEAAEAELFRNLNLPDYFPAAPRVQQVVNYKSKLWFGQGVTATVGIQAVGRTSLTMAFAVHGDAHGDEEGGIAATGTVTTVHVPPGATSAQPWPEDFLVATGSAPGAPEL
ncbi:acyl-CoA thioesterase [Paenarthrobacter sp. NPDC058040]|uniref:acyl-CoA thioesterase n=1 Tax=unclassified Paenarthrobacter TaxID=2634190 RepID=UPI0036D7F828